MLRIEYEYLCDGCGKQEIETSPGMPYGWKRIKGGHLCDECKRPKGSKDYDEA
jgi:hypothetical protein